MRIVGNALCGVPGAPVDAASSVGAGTARRPLITACSRLVSRAEPWRDRGRVGMNLARLEVEIDLATGGLGTVGSVNQVHLPAGTEVTADRSARRLQPARW